MQAGAVLAGKCLKLFISQETSFVKESLKNISSTFLELFNHLYINISHPLEYELRGCILNMFMAQVECTAKFLFQVRESFVSFVDLICDPTLFSCEYLENSFKKN